MPSIVDYIERYGPWILGATAFGIGAKLMTGSIRDRVGDIMNAVIPCSYPDNSFQAVTGGMFTPGFGSSCGFLPSYLWIQLGLVDCAIVNQNVGNCVYTPGANMSRIVNGGKALNAWVDDLTLVPKRGDVVFCSNGPANTEHVFVVDSVDGTTWNSWDGGHPAADAMSAASRTFNGPALQFIGGPRKVQGWVDLELLCQAIRG